MAALLASLACEGVVEAPQAPNALPATGPEVTLDSSPQGPLGASPTLLQGASAVTAPRGVELNAGFIGGACVSASDCTSSALTATAQCEREGFSGGMCTQACSRGASGAWLCPDSSSADATGTKCVADDADEPKCVSVCDFERSPGSGCRPGYTCVLQQRYGTSTRDSIFPVCLPELAGRWPGAPALQNDIGAACDSATECANLACLRLANGYCSKLMCDLSGCPQGSSCVRLGREGTVTACLRNCDASATPSDCRAEERYACYPGLGVCWSDPQAVGHDPSVGSADCAEAWGQRGEGLSSCDRTPDVYAVVRKSARNVALCDRGRLLRNSHAALGYTPFGDKRREGDGRTPEGVFYIPRRVPNSEFYKAFLLSYPDVGDADRGLAAGLVSAAEADAIRRAQQACAEPPQTTALGGLVELHGGSEPGASDWTYGCIAATNGEIDRLWAVLQAGDTIVVRP